MEKRLLAGLGVLVAVLAVVGGYFALSGGSSDSAQASEIRTGHGLAIANITGGNQSAQLSRNSAGSAPAAADSVSSNTGKSDVSSLPQQQAISNTGITVTGFGTATADADSAVIEFSFGSGGGVIEPQSPPVPDAAGNSGSSGSAPVDKPLVSPTTAAAITKDDLQPVIDALTGAGVAAGDIEFLNQGYDPYYSSATLRATVKNIGSVDSAVTAAQNAAGNLSGIYLQYTNVSYTVQDCSALEKAAMQSAVEDAHTRATNLAAALGVTLGSVSGASDYSYSPSGSSCSGGFYGPYPMASTPYKVGGTGQGTVQVVSNLSVTYAFQ